MKKISLWMAALVAVTVGGVYAGWTYAENAVPEVTTDKGIQLEGAVSNSDKGFYSFTQTEINPGKGLFYFDSAATANGVTGDGKNAVVLVNNCEFTVTFTAHENATPDVLANGLDTEILIHNTASNATVDFGTGAQKIFETCNNITITVSGVDTSSEYQWERSEVGGQVVFTFTLSQEDLQDLFDANMVLSDEMVLNSLAMHSAFDVAIEGMTIKTHIREKV
jgi:hypothetical protein